MNAFSFFSFLIYSLAVVSVRSIHARILKTAIFDFAPDFRCHHVVLVNDVYAIDFTQESREFRTKLLLFLGKSVPGEVRVRRLSSSVSIVDIDGALITEWISLTTSECVEKSRKITDETLNEIPDCELREFLGRFSHWNSMNLYWSNCQHFGKEVLSQKL